MNVKEIKKNNNYFQQIGGHHHVRTYHYFNRPKQRPLKRNIFHLI